jgi:GTP-binding protein
MMINWMIDASVPFVIVTTKSDKLSKTALSDALSRLEEEYFKGTGIEIIPFSSVTKEGRDAVWDRIFTAIK